MIFDNIYAIVKEQGFDHYTDPYSDAYLINANVFKIDDFIGSEKEEESFSNDVNNYMEKNINSYEKYKGTGATIAAPDNELKYYFNNPPYSNCAFCWKGMVFWVIWARNPKGWGAFTVIPFTSIPMGILEDPFYGESPLIFPFGIQRIDFYEIDTRVKMSEIYLKDFDGDPFPHTIEVSKIKIFFVNIVLRFINLVNCSNIECIKKDPPPKLNKARVRRGKLPLCSYKTLVINSNKFINRKDPNKIPIHNNRIHLCRGHFKQFTPDKPLFGKYSGLYWWQPCVRGNNKDGIVIKRYEYKE